MAGPAELWRRLSFLWNRRQIDRDLEEEIRIHVDMKAGTAVEDGAPPEEACRAARLAIRRLHTVAGDLARGLGLVLRPTSPARPALCRAHAAP